MNGKDMTDDWMNPPRSSSWTASPEPKPDDVEYLIERMKRTICFGSPGSITSWEYWAKYATPEARDKALADLHDRHPAWHLRARDRRPWAERRGLRTIL